MRRFADWLLVILAVLLPVTLAAQPVEISFDAANPPFMYSQSGKPAGLYPALVSAAFRNMRTDVILQARPWSRVIPELDKGLAGAGGLYKTIERERRFDYSEPLYIEKILVFYHKARPVSFATLEDLRGLRIGVIRGWSYGDAFDLARQNQHFSVEETAADELNFRKLSLQRLDVVLAIAESGMPQLKKFDTLAVAATPLMENPTYLAFAKSARQQALLQAFNRALKAMRANGEYELILKRELTRCPFC